MKCPRCKSTLSINSKYCNVCGIKLDEGKNVKLENEEKSQESCDEYKYLSIFIGHNASKILNGKFSFPAFFFGPLYYLFRKMYVEGTILLLLGLLIAFIDSMSFMAVEICLSIYMGLTFNRHYLKFAQNKIKKVKIFSSSKDEAYLTYEISKKGGTNIVPVIIYSFFPTVLALVIMLIAAFFMFDDEYDKYSEEEYTTIESDLRYDIPAGFKAESTNTEHFSSFYTEDRYCSFYISKIDGYVYDDDTKPTEMVLTIPHSGELEVGGALWEIETDENELSTTHTLHTTTESMDIRISFFYINDQDHKYCEDSYEELVSSLKIEQK